MIITIDGPAGSGKSTAARKLAGRLEIAYLDTGAMYRAVTLAAMRRGLDASNAPELFELARSMHLNLDCGPTHTRVRLDGHDVSEAIRSLEVSRGTSTIANDPAIRGLLVDRQREIGRKLVAFVTEGRDQGSVVFPNADTKFVLIASPQKRAERRYQEFLAEGESVIFAEVLDNIINRDQVDIKHWEPLLRPGASHVLDTSNLTLHEVVDRMLEITRGV